MNDGHKDWLNARRNFLRITGPVYSSMTELSGVFVCDEEYRKAIIKAADQDKPKPRKLTKEDRKRHHQAAARWIKAMATWAKDMRSNPLPRRK